MALWLSNFRNERVCGLVRWLDEVLMYAVEAELRTGLDEWSGAVLEEMMMAWVRRSQAGLSWGCDVNEWDSACRGGNIKLAELEDGHPGVGE